MGIKFQNGKISVITLLKLGDHVVKFMCEVCVTWNSKKVSK